ncbi:MAG: hypothetical protein JMDDDDMK_05558 [Acidobacteria bacterium]|nr:hypothetical protein [Acidobacteriota bacterium]
MHFLKSQFHRINITLFSLLIMFCVTVTPDRQWAKTGAVAQCPTITLTPANLPGARVGVQYSRSILPSGGAPPYTMSLFLGSFPPGLTLSFNTISGTPTAAGSYSFTMRARDANNCFGSQAYTINVAACPTINIPLNSFGGTVGAPYSNIISASGGTAPYTFSLVPPNGIPPGLTLSSAGALSGTPTTAGRYSFGVRATDANGCAGSKTITANICPTITMNPLGALTGWVGVAYSWGFLASGGQPPYTYVITSGALPPGLTLSPGTISGTPTTEGRYTFTLRGVDANGCSGERQYTLPVNCPTITINPTILSVPQVGASYNQTFSASGGAAPYAFSLAAGSLPPGLSLASNGNLTGAPTAAGSYSYIVRATDANGCRSERAYTQNVLPCSGVTISPTGTGVPSGRINTPYSLTFTATGATGPYTFSLATGSSLPPGLTLSSAGLLSGTPTMGGGFSFSVVATSANGCVGQVLNYLYINPCPLITINPTDPNLPAATINTPYSRTFSATSGTAPYTFTLTGTPPLGLALNTTTGVLSGSPTQAGTFIFNIRVTDTNGCIGLRTYTLPVNPACPAITLNPTNSNLPAGATGAPYSLIFTVTGGTAPYSFIISGGALPSGLSLAPNGNLTGVPTTAGNYNFNVRATDAKGCVDEINYDLVINNPVCPAITLNPTNSNLPAGATGAPYSLIFTVTGGTAPYSFIISGGALPPGLSLASNGNLTGVPTTAGNYNFNVRATDAKGCVDEINYGLVINNPACPTITLNPANTALPAGTIGGGYNQTFLATGGTAPYSFIISGGAPPPGLSLASNGNLTGVPTAPGSYSFTVRATDSNGCLNEQAYAIVIAVNVVTSVSAASFAANTAVAPESIVAAFGSNMATSTQAASTLPLPTVLAGISLKVTDGAGAERLAPLFFVSPSQINYQIPPGAAVGPASVTVMNGAGVAAEGAAQIATVSPGLFTADASGQGLAFALVLRIKANGTQSYEPVAQYDAAQNRFVAVPIDLGPETDQVFLILYGTGFKFRSSLSTVSCAIGGESAEILFAGEAPGFVGLDQANMRLSRALTGRGEVDVTLSVEGKASNTVRVAIR